MNEFDKVMGYYWKSPTYKQFENTLDEVLHSRKQTRRNKIRELENQFLCLTQPGACVKEFVMTSCHKEFSRILSLILSRGGKRRQKHIIQLKEYFLAFLQDIMIITGKS